MNKFFFVVLVFLYIIFCGGCVNIANQFKVSEKEIYHPIKDTTLNVNIEENIRDIPNGEIIGKTMKNEKFKLVGRRGNWVCVQNRDFPKGFIYGPSLGYNKINMFALSTWYDTQASGFYDLQQYINFLGQAKEISEYFNLKKYSFIDLGFGFSNEVIMDQNGKAETRRKSKGVYIIVNDDGFVREIHIDLKDNINDISDAKNLLKVNLAKPSTSDNTHVAWQDKFGLSKIQLLRSEFGSDSFNQIVLIQ